jgi:two-component system, NarL family, response regulator NreC
MDLGMDRIRILVAEDHELFRKGICRLIENVPDMEIVGEAADGEDAVRKARELAPDIVIMDVMLPGMNGIEATRIIHHGVFQTKIVTLSLHSDREYIIGMMKAGSSGYLLKDSAFQELIEAIRNVQGNRIFLGQTLIQTIAKDLSDLLGRVRMTQILTASERDVLGCLAEGKKTSEIASSLSVQPGVIERDRDNIINKWLMLFR